MIRTPLTGLLAVPERVWRLAKGEAGDAAPTLSVAVPDSSGGAAHNWPLAQRIAFRFVFAYLVLYNCGPVPLYNSGSVPNSAGSSLPFPLGLIPGTSRLAEGYSKLWSAFVAWTGKRVLHLSQELVFVDNGSGDKTFDYVLLACTVAFAILAAVIWSIVDQRRAKYDKLFAWLRVYVRYVLGWIMLSYGIDKVFKVQFLFPSPIRLTESYGDSSPMGLLWAFMGYSTPYTIFAGLSEAVGGVLLFFRRTATLGALLLVAVLTNIVILNFSYDVPVKLFSSNLLLMSVFLLAPDLRRIANALVLNRPTEKANFDSLLPRGWLRIVGIGLKTLLVGFLLFSITKRSWELQRTRGDNAPKGPLYGLYEVEDFVKNHQMVPPLTTELKRWRKVMVGRTGTLSVRFMDDSYQHFKTDLDAAKKTISLEVNGKKSVLTYSQPDEAHLILEGALMDDSITVRTRKTELSKFLLVNRGFHWINEVPFNR